ncbi:sigma factor [Acidaminobacter sp. JC074]|uniref:sigma factor n=1 Tax=Acidaminobacter sp. JC074 TaxID=2530199 RepID=UPI001F0F96DC|nr:sigma factor [Acidaminobacter sp. JC074]
MTQAIDKHVYKIILENDKTNIDNFINEYRPFIIKTISDLKGSYLDIHNDDEYSIGLIAFNEALKKYQPDKGRFLSYAKLVIESRIKNHWKSQHLDEHTDYENVVVESNHVLRDEIEYFEKVLLSFGVDFEILIDHAPKHVDTRKRAIHIGEETSKVPSFVEHIYAKKRLPITLMSKAFDTSIKIIKKSKLFIISVVIIFDKKLTAIQEWLK